MYSVLRCMLARCGKPDPVISAITVLSDGAENSDFVRIDLPDDDNEYEIYPAFNKQLLFKVTREPGPTGRLRRFLVETQLAATPQDVEGLHQWLLPWAKLLESGAYAWPSSRPLEAFCQVGPVTLFDAYTLEGCINRFEASECAWFSLLNMVGASPNRTSIVQCVNID